MLGKRFLRSRFLILTFAAAFVLIGRVSDVSSLEPFPSGRDSVFDGFALDEETILRIFGRGDVPSGPVHSVVLEDAKGELSDLYYPVWVDENIVFLARNRGGAYVFYRYDVGSGTRLVSEIQLGASEGQSGGVFAQDSLIPLEENEPPLRSPVINPQSGEIAFSLTELEPRAAVSIHVLDGLQTREVYRNEGQISLSSLGWADQKTLVFVESQVRSEPRMIRVDVQSGSVREVAKGYVAVAPFFGGSRVAAVDVTSGVDRLVLLDSRSFEVIERTELEARQVNKVVWGPDGRYVAAVAFIGLGNQLVIYDSHNGGVHSVESTEPIFLPEVGAIFLDYLPVWDGSGSLYYVAGRTNLATRLFRYEPDTRQSELVHDFVEDFTAVSAFAVSRYWEQRQGFSSGSQIVVSGLQRGNTGVRSAELYFFPRAFGVE